MLPPMRHAFFTLSAHASPDYSLAANWSDGLVPGLGTLAVIDDASVLVDPQSVLSARILLLGQSGLSGNGGGFSLGYGGALIADGDNTLFADGAIVNQGIISLDGPADTLRVTVDNGATQPYGLTVPSLKNPGFIDIAGGATLDVLGTELSNTGSIVIDGATLFVSGGAVDGGQGRQPPPGGQIVLEDHASAVFADGVSDQNIRFSGADTLSLEAIAQTDQVTITSFDPGSEILLPSLAEAKAALGVLSFQDLPAHTMVQAVPTASGGALKLEPAPPCFARGTRLLTPTGYVAVEQLRPGDPVVTAAGDTRPLRWVGLRTLDIATHSRPDTVRPVRLLAGAVSPGIPARPVRLSPDHALLLDGLLVPVKLLVNGATILREVHCQAVTYHHVELDRHDILLSEGLAVESYLDTGNRAMFETTVGMPRRHPVFGRGRQWDHSAYAELCLEGPRLRDIRQAIRARTLEMGYRPRSLTEVALWVDGAQCLPVVGPPTRPQFRLPAHAGRITIRSARFVPAEFNLDAAQDDNRSLGIALSAIRLGTRQVLAGAVALSGVYPRNPDERADWTDGNAVIAVPPALRDIGLRIAAWPQGWLPPGM
jgi:hypothetical protein